MINQICNTNTEHHIDTFYKIAIIKAKDISYFDEFYSDEEIDQLITNIPSTAEVIITDFLPKKNNIKTSTKIDSAGTVYNTSISFIITPQDKNLQRLLETYQNKEVVVLISKRNTSHLYGTKAIPFIFKYSPKNSNDAKVVKGYDIQIIGNSIASEKIFEEIQFNIYDRGLAFQLAQQL